MSLEFARYWQAFVDTLWMVGVSGGFAFLAGIPLAALGYLNPVLAGAAMALSSVSVMSNALLLKRWKP